MSVLLHRQHARLDDWSVDRTIVVATPSSLFLATWLSIAFMMPTVIMAPVCSRSSTMLALAVLSTFTLVSELLALRLGLSYTGASCSVSEVIAGGSDQVLNGMAL